MFSDSKFFNNNNMIIINDLQGLQVASEVVHLVFFEKKNKTR